MNLFDLIKKGETKTVELKMTLPQNESIITVGYRRILNREKSRHFLTVLLEKINE